MAHTVVAARIQRERTSTDTLLLQDLSAFLTESPCGTLLDATLSVARDRSASSEARGYALFALARALSPQSAMSYSAISAGLDAAGVPAKGCSSGRISDVVSPPAMAEADRVRVRRMAMILYKDTTQPASVRSAAYCIL